MQNSIRTENFVDPNHSKAPRSARSSNKGCGHKSKPQHVNSWVLNFAGLVALMDCFSNNGFVWNRILCSIAPLLVEITVHAHNMILQPSTLLWCTLWNVVRTNHKIFWEFLSTALELFYVPTTCENSTAVVTIAKQRDVSFSVHFTRSAYFFLAKGSQREPPLKLWISVEVLLRPFKLTLQYVPLLFLC